MAGSVAHGHWTFWLSAAAPLDSGAMDNRDEMVTMIARASHPMSPAPLRAALAGLVLMVTAGTACTARQAGPAMGPCPP
jgi:hypothetical protein